MITNILCVLGGMIMMWCLNYLMIIGHSVNMLKYAQQNCAALFVISEQGSHEILELKYLAMKEAKRTEQNIVSQKYIDQLNIQSIKKTIMRNYVLTFPEPYKHLMEYSNWEELEGYVNKFTQKNKEK